MCLPHAMGIFSRTSTRQLRVCCTHPLRVTGNNCGSRQERLEKQQRGVREAIAVRVPGRGSLLCMYAMCLQSATRVCNILSFRKRKDVANTGG